jgi:aspartate oxidase
LKSVDGREFMDAFSPHKSLAPRDVVAAPSTRKMKRTGADCVLLDITHKPARFLMDRFPNIYQTCLHYGIDMTKEPIPVVAGGALSMRGVVTTVDGATETQGLFAIGEAAVHRPARGQSAGEQFLSSKRASVPTARRNRSPKTRARIRRPHSAWQSGDAQRSGRTRRRRRTTGMRSAADVGLRGHRAHEQAPANARARASRTCRRRSTITTGTSLSRAICSSCATSPPWPN